MLRTLLIIGLCAGLVLADYETKNNVIELNSENYKKFISEQRKCVILWFSDKCKVCNRMKPNYELAAKYSSIPLARINILENKELADEIDVDGYPTVYFYNNEEKTEYDGPLTTVAILEYLSHYEESRR